MLLAECIPTRRINKKAREKRAFHRAKDGTALSDTPAVSSVTAIPAVATVSSIPTVAAISSVAAIDRSIAAIDCTISAAIGGIAHHGCCDNR
jgi:hypothetical protein